MKRWSYKNFNTTTISHLKLICSLMHSGRNLFSFLTAFLWSGKEVDHDDREACSWLITVSSPKSLPVLRISHCKVDEKSSSRDRDREPSSVLWFLFPLFLIPDIWSCWDSSVACHTMFFRPFKINTNAEGLLFCSLVMYGFHSSFPPSYMDPRHTC